MNVTIKMLVKSAILQYETDDIVEAWNMYCKAHKKEDYHVYKMGEFGDVYADASPFEIACAAQSYKFNPEGSDYFSYDEIGRLTSFSGVEDKNLSVIELDDLADWFIKNKGVIDGCDIEITNEDIIAIYTEDYLSQIYDGGYSLAVEYMEDFCKTKGTTLEDTDLFEFDFNEMLKYYADVYADYNAD